MLIAIDPGPHTGTVIWDQVADDYDFETLDFTLEGVTEPHSDLWMWMVQKVHLGDTIICEKFEYQKEKAQTRAHLNYDAAEYVGIVKYFGQRCKTLLGVKLVMQSPAIVVGQNNFWTDDKLRKIGLYRTIKHERDALRHLLYYRTFTLGDQTLLHKLK